MINDFELAIGSLNLDIMRLRPVDERGVLMRPKIAAMLRYVSPWLTE